MRSYRFALCYSDPSPLSCRTGFQVMSTHRTLPAARHKYSTTTGAGFYVAEKIGGEYRRISAPWNGAVHLERAQ